jgi:hypothetical protein
MPAVPGGFPQKDQLTTPTASIPTPITKRSRFIALSVFLGMEGANCPWWNCGSVPEEASRSRSASGFRRSLAFEGPLTKEWRIKKPRADAGLFSYLRVPEPGPVGANVEPLGEEFGPSVLPEGLAVSLGLVTAPPAPELPVVRPIDEPVVVPPVAEPPAVELPPTEPPPEDPVCANANVLESAKAVASAIVVSFIVVSLSGDGWITAVNDRSFQKKRPSGR